MENKLTMTHDEEVALIMGITGLYSCLGSAGFNVPSGIMSSCCAAIYSKVMLGQKRLYDPEDSFSLAGMRKEAEGLLSLIKGYVPEEFLDKVENDVNELIDGFKAKERVAQ